MKVSLERKGIDTSNSDKRKDIQDMEIGAETREMLGKLEVGHQKSIVEI